MYAVKSVQKQASTGQLSGSHPPSSFWPARKEHEVAKHILRSNPSLPDLTAEGSTRKPKAVAIPTTRTPGSDREATTSMHRSVRSADPVKIERPPSRGTTPPVRQTKEDVERQKATKSNNVPTPEPSSWGSFRLRRKESKESLVDGYTPVVPTVSTVSGSPNQASSIRRLRSLGFLRRKNSSVSATSSPSSTSLVSQTNVTTTPSGSSHGHSNSSNSTTSNGSHPLPTQQQQQQYHTQVVPATTVFPSLKSGTSFAVTKTVNSSLVTPSSSSTDSSPTSFLRPPKANPSIRRSISLYEATGPRDEQLPGTSSSLRSRHGIKRPVVLPPTSTRVVARTPCTYDVTHRRPIRPRSSSLPLDTVLINKLKALSSEAENSPSTPSRSLPPSSMNTPPSTSSSTTRPSTPRTQNRYAAVYRPPPSLDANGQARPGHPKPALSLSMPNGVAIIEPLRPSASPTVRVGSGNQSLAGNGSLNGSEKTVVAHPTSNLNSNTITALNGNGNLNNAKSTIGSAGPSGPSSSSLMVPNSPFPSLATPATPHTPRTPHTPHTPFSAYTLTAPLASPYSIGSPSSTSVRPPPRAPVPVSPGASPEQRGTKPLPPLSALSARFESSSHGSPKLGQSLSSHSARNTPTPTPTHPSPSLHPLTLTNSGNGSGNLRGLLGPHARTVATTTPTTATANTMTNTNPSANPNAITNTTSGGSKVPTNVVVPVRPADNLNENSNSHTVTGASTGAPTATSAATTTTTTTKSGVSAVDIAKWTADVNAQLNINVNNLRGTNQTNEAAPSTNSNSVTLTPAMTNERIGGEPRTIYRAPPTLELALVSPTSYNSTRRPSLPILSTTSPSSLLSPVSLLPHPHSQTAGKNAATATTIPSSLSSGKGTAGTVGTTVAVGVAVALKVPAPSPEPSIMEDDDVLWNYFEKKGLASSMVPSSTPPPIPSLTVPSVSTSTSSSSTLLPGRSLSANAVLSRPTPPPSLPLPPIPTTRPPNPPSIAVPTPITSATNSPRKNSQTQQPSTPFTPRTPHTPYTTGSLHTSPLSAGVSPSTPHTPYTPASTSAKTIPPAITTTAPAPISTTGKMLRRPRHTISHSSSAALPSPSAQSVKSTFLPTQSVFLQSQTLYLPSSPPPPSTFLPSPGGTDAMEAFPLTPFTPNFFSRESMSKDGHEAVASASKKGNKQVSYAESQILPISPPVSPRTDEV